MAKRRSLNTMYKENTIGTKMVDGLRTYLSGADKQGNQLYVVKKVKRIRYLKICWNCSCSYESWKYNSYACSPKCSYNINYKLAREMKPPADMPALTKNKRTKPIKEMFGYE